MVSFKGLNRRERREKRAELESLVKESVCSDLMPKTKFQILEYIEKRGFSMDPYTLERYAMKILDYTTYGEIRPADGGRIIKPYGTHGSTKLFLPKDPYLKDRAVRNLSRYR